MEILRKSRNFTAKNMEFMEMKPGDSIVVMEYSGRTYPSAIGVVAPERARRYIDFMTNPNRTRVMCIVRLKALKNDKAR